MRQASRELEWSDASRTSHSFITSVWPARKACAGGFDDGSVAIITKSAMLAGAAVKEATQLLTALRAELSGTGNDMSKACPIVQKLKVSLHGLHCYRCPC